MVKLDQLLRNNAREIIEACTNANSRISNRYDYLARPLLIPGHAIFEIEVAVMLSDRSRPNLIPIVE